MKPNIIFILSDQQRWDTCGCYGQHLNVTPHLDKMAREGVRFDHAFTCQPVCGPARSSLQTGKYPAKVGTYRNDIYLPRDERTIAHHFSEQGYHLGYIGKWHLASDLERGINYQSVPVPRHMRGGWKDYWLASDILEFTSHSYDGHMFDTENKKRYFPEGRYRVDAVSDWAIEYIESRKESLQPFFLFLSFIEPHHQNDHNRYEGPHGARESFSNYEVPGDLKGTEGDWKENYPDYLGAIHSIDNNLGRIRDTLKRLGIDKNTIIFFTSDHGSHFRTRNDEYKRSCHDASTHIPMVVAGAGIPKGKSVDSLVSLIDVPPTLLQFANIPVPEVMHGRPLQAVFDENNSSTDWTHSVFMQISESSVARAIRTKKWKFSMYDPNADGWSESSGTNYVSQYLYNLEEDPHERTNLVNDLFYKSVCKELSEKLKQHMRAAGEDVDSLTFNP